jgi:hypothetical protein
MPGLKLTILTATVSTAAAVGLAATANASPAGPCAEVLYVGVCAPASEQPSPPTQQSQADAFLPDANNNGIHVVN